MDQSIGWLFVLLAWILILVLMMIVFIGPIFQIIHIMFASIGTAKPNKKLFNTFNVIGFCLSIISFLTCLVMAILTYYGSSLNTYANTSNTQTMMIMSVISSMLFMANITLFITCLIRRSKFKKKCLNKHFYFIQDITFLTYRCPLLRLL